LRSLHRLTTSSVEAAYSGEKIQKYKGAYVIRHSIIHLK
jgi:hypothetical protein